MELCKVPYLNGASTSLRIPTAASACLWADSKKQRSDSSHMTIHQQVG